MSQRRVGVVQWVVVLAVGVIVVAIIVALKLIPRFDDGQKVLNGARPAFTSERLQADEAGIDLISKNVDMANPIVQASGGGASEVPTLVAYAAKRLHLSPARTLTLLQRDFPHTTALLEAVPLSSVSAELPPLMTFLEKTLKLSQPQLLAELKAKVPALTQAITNLPAVTAGWNAIPGISGLTRFDGAPVHSVPQLRDYFQDDLIPAVRGQQRHFQSLDGTSSINWIAPLLLIVGIIVIVFALAMIVRRSRGTVRRGEAVVTAAVVPIVGIVVVALVLVLALVPRTSNGQKLLDGLKPAFVASRVRGDRVGINMVSTIVNTENPIMTPSGGAAGEVPTLIGLVATKTGLTDAQVLATLQAKFPHVADLLQALPLSAVSAELPRVTKALGPGVATVIPRLLPTIANAPAVTAGWNDVPGTSSRTTRFDGTPIRTMPQVRDYFSDDVIPVLERQRKNFDSVSGTSKIDFIGPLVLVIGIIVVIYGVLMVLLAWRTAEPPLPSPPLSSPIENPADVR
jgi:hypothetical protein